MKPCILLMIGCLVLSNASAQWKKVYIPATKDLYDVQLINNVGYAAGDNSAILKSTDSGKSWKNLVLTIPENLRAMYFLDSNTGMVIGENARIQKTTDGGKNWTQKYIRTAAYGYGMAFLNNHGLAVGKDMLVISSDDYGETWTVDTTLSKFKKLNSVTILPDGNCWAVGDSGYILSKKITAKKWKITRYPTKVDLNHVSFSGAGNIYIAGGMPDSAIVGKFYNIQLTSNDSGKTWQQYTHSEMKIINSAFYINNDTGILCGSNGIISRCNNGGSDCALQLTGSASSLNKIVFSNGVGLVVGDGGALLRTTNYGGFRLAVNAISNKGKLGNIFPNPCSGSFELMLDAGNFEVSIYNAKGQMVYKDEDYFKGKKIFLENQGLYTVRIMDSAGNCTFQKLIVITH